MLQILDKNVTLYMLFNPTVSFKSQIMKNDIANLRKDLWKWKVTYFRVGNANINTLKLHCLPVSKRIIFKVHLLTLSAKMELDLNIGVIFLFPMLLVTDSDRKHLDYLEFHVPNRSLMKTGHFPRLRLPCGNLYFCLNSKQYFYQKL